MKKIIFDCDNTMGVEGCDVDDGLALLYLLGKSNVEILGITAVYGNSDVETVYSTTMTMTRALELDDIPVVKGSSGPHDRDGEAAKFIVDTVRANRGNVSILATGTLTNLYAAYLLDDRLFDRVNEVVLMGGITEPLIVNGRELKELNLSGDPVASEYVLRNGRNVSVLTGNNCLDAFFPEREFVGRLTAHGGPKGEYIVKKSRLWLDHMKGKFDIEGSYHWDVLAAAYLAEPTVFRDVEYRFRPSADALRTGLLVDRTGPGPACTVNLPRISALGPFFEEVYGAWLGTLDR
jgi:purine nucleosidase